MLGTGSLLFAFVTPRETQPQTHLTAPVALKPVVAVPKIEPLAAPTPISAPVINTANVLNERRQFALGMIETGNNDREIGGAGEISRYQIMPAIWHQYTDSRSYRNPDISSDVARQLWSGLYTQFKQQAHREPTDFDMYVLWNTRSDYYASRSFNPARLAPNVRDRAQRFVNLVERGSL